MVEEQPGCGTCTMCCKLMAIRELNKPSGEWCKHCDRGRGCRIYEDRPQTCAAFECVWLISQHKSAPQRWPLDARPDQCRAVVVSTLDNQACVIRPDPRRPDDWKGTVLARIMTYHPHLGWFLEDLADGKAHALNERAAEIADPEALEHIRLRAPRANALSKAVKASLTGRE